LKKYTFTIVIEKEPEDPGYYAHVPALPGCVSAGLTIEELRENIVEAIHLYIESLVQDGLPIPDADNPVQVERVTVAISA
jgi:predicted RNase H-like HicB family nuclease